MSALWGTVYQKSWKMFLLRVPPGAIQRPEHRRGEMAVGHARGGLLGERYACLSNHPTPRRSHRYSEDVSYE